MTYITVTLVKSSFIFSRQKKFVSSFTFCNKEDLHEYFEKEGKLL